MKNSGVETTTTTRHTHSWALLCYSERMRGDNEVEQRGSGKKEIDGARLLLLLLLQLYTILSVIYGAQ